MAESAAASAMEHELCANCKKEIPQQNYVMHMAHCARNIALCPVCKEPVPRNQLEDHKKKHSQPSKLPPVKKSSPQPTGPSMRNSAFKTTNIDPGNKLGATAKTNGLKTTVHEVKNPPKQASPERPKRDKMIACGYCELELPKGDLAEHEEYCGTRTDKCNECGEFVMFKYKKLHEDSNHGFIKLTDEPGPKPSWDSNSQRTSTTTAASPNSAYESYSTRRSRLPPLQPFDMSTLYNAADYIPPSYGSGSSRFNNNKGPAPQPPPSRRRNPPTELSIPCEFCQTPIPHEDLIQHETGCRPDLARLNPRRRSPSPDDYFVAPPPSSPEVELPCEFCADMFPASQLLRHQATCN